MRNRTQFAAGGAEKRYGPLFMGTRGTPFTLTVALAAGAGLWVATAALAGRAEAWDSPLYWQATYPCCIAVAGFLAYLEPKRAWRWALAIMLIQPVAMVLTGSGSFGLLPLGLVLFAALALPPVLAARLGARLRLRRDQKANVSARASTE